MNMNRNFKALLSQFCGFHFSEDEAREHWYCVTHHQKGLEETLARPIGFSVALADYFLNVLRKNREIFIVEPQDFIQMKDSAYQDSLTGLYNRRYLKDYLEKEFEKTKRYSIVFSILFLDIDRFKILNDQYGHACGDHVLKRVAEILKHSSRNSDLVARFGGEEFVVVMPQTLGRKTLEVAQRLRRNIESQVFDVPGVREPIRLTLSGGIATCPMDAKNYDELLHRADQAMYFAKTQGRNQIFHYRDISEKALREANL